MRNAVVLVLILDPGCVSRLASVPGLKRAGRGRALSLEWFDTPDATLLGRDTLLVREGSAWRLMRDGEAWAAPPLLAEARNLAALGPAVPDGVVPRERWNGTRHCFTWTGPDGSAELTVLDGRFDRPALAPACRLHLFGPGMLSLAAELTRAGARLPVTTLGRDAMQAPPPVHRTTTPDPEQQPGSALAAIIAGQLAAMQRWSAVIPAAATPEPVHQMRVATRRLRAALSTFRKATPSPELLALGPALKDCAARLGAARDWDVFLEGAGARLAEAFPEDARCRAMLRAAERRRKSVYKELRGFLAGPEFAVLLVALAHAATVQPWPAEDARRLEEFAAERLSARFRTVRRAARDISTIPVSALHELRKDCKRLRYTAEFLAPLFPRKPAKRFLSVLAELQEELGRLNDGAAVGGLMAQLGRTERGYAAGLAEGFTAAGSGVARHRIGKAWKRLRNTDRFWPTSEKLGNPLTVAEKD